MQNGSGIDDEYGELVLKSCMDMLSTLQTANITKDSNWQKSHTTLSSLTKIGTIKAYEISITDAALQGIANGAANLSKLSMVDCNINNTKLKLIANLNNLQKLDLDQNGSTQDSINKLRKALILTNIHYRSPKKICI